MAAYQAFQFFADTVNGQILSCPKLFYIRCEQAIPIGVDIVKQFNKTECIVAKKVFLISYGGQLLGSTQFSSVFDFVTYMNDACTPVNHCTIFLGNCQILFNGCYVLT